MARDFSAGANLENTAATTKQFQILGDCSVSVVFRRDASITGFHNIFGVGGGSPDNEANNHALYVGAVRESSVNKLVWFWESGAGINHIIYFHNLVVTLGQEYRAVFVRDAGSKWVSAYLSGLSDSYSYSTNPTGGGNGWPRIGDTALGSQTWDGMLAEIGLWNTALTPAQAQSFTLGHRKPSDISPASLVEYWPITGTTAIEHGAKAATAMTLTGTAPYEAHPKMISAPGVRAKFLAPVPAAGGFEPAWARPASGLISGAAL